MSVISLGRVLSSVRQFRGRLANRILAVTLSGKLNYIQATHGVEEVVIGSVGPHYHIGNKH
jgi:hypothetical protein